MDAAFGEIRRQLDYKSRWYGSKLKFVDRFFPSTKLCPRCGCIVDMPLSRRIFKCPNCGYGPIDRDVHAAQNVLRQVLSEGESVVLSDACGDGSQSGPSMKQEIFVNNC